MSYIHQALKKAQAQREEGHKRYEGLFISSRSMRSDSKKWTLIAAVLLGILLLAFVAYSWLDGVAPESATNGPQKSRDPGPVSVREMIVDVETLYQVGRTHHAGGRQSEAKAFYEKALKADPGYVLALNNLGVILMAEKNYSAARMQFEKAIRLEPDYADACYNLACLFALTDRREQGLNYLKRAISLDPKAKSWAKEDADLETLRKEPAFKEMVGG